jgi:hypothetical protein
MNKIFLMVLVAWGCFADQYWVSPTGAATWANAKSATPLSGAACCLLLQGTLYGSAPDIGAKESMYKVRKEATFNIKRRSK